MENLCHQFAFSSQHICTIFQPIMQRLKYDKGLRKCDEVLAQAFMAGFKILPRELKTFLDIKFFVV